MYNSGKFLEREELPASSFPLLQCSAWDGNWAGDPIPYTAKLSNGNSEVGKAGSLMVSCHCWAAYRRTNTFLS